MGYLQNKIIATVVALSVGTAAACGQTVSSVQHKWAIVLHGGAGVIERSTMDPKTEAAYRASLNAALKASTAVLDKGGSSVDAIETAIKLMEDDPLFNAGRGAVFTAEGKNEPTHLIHRVRYQPLERGNTSFV